MPWNCFSFQRKNIGYFEYYWRIVWSFTYDDLTKFFCYYWKKKMQVFLCKILILGKKLV
jgi:hypothetical protein